MRTFLPARAVATTVLGAGLLVSGVATAAPLSASETMHAKLHKLRMCESGNRYSADTGNGYYGAYQFGSSTWHSLGFHGRPDRAAHRTQDAAARKLHARSGWSAWPSCSRREHL